MQRIFLTSRSKAFWSLIGILTLFPLFSPNHSILISSARAEAFYNFSDMAMSGDGHTIYLTNSGGSIWKSSNTGSTWTSLSSAGSKNWETIATSQDGSVVVVGETSDRHIYVSTDGGSTWSVKTGAGTHVWRSISVSNDGTKIRAITSDTLKLYESNDSGNTWTENATLPIVLNTDYNPDGTRSSNGCSNPCSVPNWAALTMSGSANKIALLVTAPGPYHSGRQLFISQDGGTSWEETEGCCRDQSTLNQIASSRSDTSWTIAMGNFQSSAGYLRYDATGGHWTRTSMRIHEVAGDSNIINTTTWKAFALAADGDQIIFSGAYAGWVVGQPGRYESLFSGAISTEPSGVFHDDSPGSFYRSVAISDDGSVRAALAMSTGQIVISTDSGVSYSKIKIFNLPLTPSFGTQSEYSDYYTIPISNYDSSYSWSVSSTSGTASIDGSGLVTVRNPVGASTLTVRTSKTGVIDGEASFSALDLARNVTSAATWASVPLSSASNVFTDGSVYEIAVSPITGDIYVGGSFTNAAGIADADYIARFDGTSWHALSGPSGGLSDGSGGGYNGVFALTFDSSGNLYAGGKFANAGGDANADNIAKWNGTAWSSLGATPLNDSVRAIDVQADGMVLAGGLFTNAGGVSGADYIAAWNGSAWSKFGSSSLDSYVLQIKHSRNSHIYISGHFNNAGGDTHANRVAMYNGTNWTAIGDGGSIPGPATAIAIDDRTTSDVLYVGGNFWDGTYEPLRKYSDGTWSRLSYGLNSVVRELKFSPTYGLLVAGWFNPTNKFATGLGVLAGTTFYGVGDSNNDGTGGSYSLGTNVESVYISETGKIYVGGSFSAVASVSNTRNFAQTTSWTAKSITVATPSPTQTVDAMAERIRKDREAEEKKQKARAALIHSLAESKPITQILTKDTELPKVSERALELANNMLLGQSVESRTSVVEVIKVFTKANLIDDLTSEKPKEYSVKKLTEYGIFPPKMLYPNYTLFLLKKLPVELRTDLVNIQKYVEVIQKRFQDRELRRKARR